MAVGLLEMGASALVLTASAMLYSQGTVLIAGHLIGLVGAAVFGVALTVVGNLYPLITAMAIPLATLSSEWHARNDRERLRRDEPGRHAADVRNLGVHRRRPRPLRGSRRYAGGCSAPTGPTRNSRRPGARSRSWASRSPSGCRTWDPDRRCWVWAATGLSASACWRPASFRSPRRGRDGRRLGGHGRARSAGAWSGFSRAPCCSRR